VAAAWLGLWAVCASAVPGPRQGGVYNITVSGYYSGNGTATASRATVSIEADLEDDTGKVHKLRASGLTRDPERHYLFRGKGALDNMEVAIDGRMDAPDRRKSEVLKNGRIMFTFKVLANGHHGRGGGERVSPANGRGAPGAGGGGPGPTDGSGGSSAGAPRLGASPAAGRG
jgi:hypothetical protein